MESLDGDLGSVTFNPNDPSSIELALQTMTRIIDERVGAYASNSVIGPQAERIKEKYREAILEKAAAARLERSEVATNIGQPVQPDQ